MSTRLEFDLKNLTDICEQVNPIDAKNTVAALKAKLKKYPDLYALSAPQIGIKEQVICIKFNDGKIQEYINPIILKAEDYHFVRERDISCGEHDYINLRPQKATIRYQIETAKPEENVVKGVVAEVFERMVNYLNGITPVDFGLEVDEDWDSATPEEQAEILELYKKSLIKRAEAANRAVEEDKDAKQLKDAIRFMESVDKGETILDWGAVKKVHEA